MKSIRLYGVKQNNLKNIDVEIPMGSFTVICGPSGSGKSSLAFETLYAEGQRRYIESLSNYTKQFLNKAPKPLLDDIQNVPPALALEQKNSVKTSRATVGTTSEIIDYLRLLFAKIGHAYCSTHSIPFRKDTPFTGAKKITQLLSGKRGYILAPLYPNKEVKTDDLYEALKKEGFLRLYVPKKTKPKSKKKQEYRTVSIGEVIDINDKAAKKALKGTCYIIIDRMAFKENEEGRLTDSLSIAYQSSMRFNSELMCAEAHALTTDGEELLLSEDFSCTVCSERFPQINSQFFSFNSPSGACEDCKGFGNRLELDEKKVIPNPHLSIDQGAIQPFTMPSARRDKRKLIQFCNKKKISLKKAWCDLKPSQKEMIWDGTSEFYGVRGLFDRLETKKYKMHVRVFLSRYKSPKKCTTCDGTRLKQEVNQVLIDKKTITKLCDESIDSLFDILSKLKISKEDTSIALDILDQLKMRLSYLKDVGLGYLNLNRSTKSLSGGEYQRLMLSNQLGQELSQTLYVLDEPTVGLHPRDNHRLINILKKLNKLGNTLVVVEHDHDVMLNSSHIIEMGPESGHLGGDIIYSGTTKKFLSFKDSNTSFYLNGKGAWTMARHPRPVDMSKSKYFIEVLGCTGNNLKDIDFKIPLHRLVTVTGVSGSGKSSLVSETFYPALARAMGHDAKEGHPHVRIAGLDHLKNILFIDQKSIGKNSRSTPMSYLKIYDEVRKLFSLTREAKAKGYTAGTFSLNVDGGRCTTCKGLGVEIIDMVFMDDIEIPCDHCNGLKFREEILDVKFKGKSIVDVMNMTVEEGFHFFISQPKVRKALGLLKDVGLSYIRLGQGATTLSGGESQRLKIAKELYTSDQISTLYILDEPTTGLHYREVHLLLKILHKLIDAGNSVLLIEHNLEVIRNSDYIIDIGPEAGDRGGKIVAQGTPSEVAKKFKSPTAKYLKEYLSAIKAI